MTKEDTTPFQVIEEANSKTLDYFNQLYVSHLELVQGLKTELFELEIQIETLERTKELYTPHTDKRKNIFSPVDGPSDRSVTRGKQIAEQLQDLEDAKLLLEKRIADLEEDTLSYKEQIEMLARAQKCIHTVTGEGYTESAKDTLDSEDEGIEFIEDEDTGTGTEHNYNVLMLQDYANYQRATDLDQHVKQELISSFHKLDVLKWLLHSDLERARVTLDELHTSQESIVHSIDQILEQLNYDINTKQPVWNQVNHLVKTYQREHPECSIDLSCDCSEQDLNLTWFISIRLIQMLREVFNNIFQHANADRITAKVFLSSRLIDVDIHDNGVGISEDYLDTSDWYSGLHKIHEIIYQLDGNLQIQGDLITGTNVRFSFPVK
ncbi:MAG: hypothetical protein IJ801_10395 [Lachnospiraceae bacterium]|nr:hypothetical protein [Lachnospiraceae bacterium]